MSNLKSVRRLISKKVGEKVLLTQSVVRPLWRAAALLDRACRAPSCVFATKERKQSKETPPLSGFESKVFFHQTGGKIQKEGGKNR